MVRYGAAGASGCGMGQKGLVVLWNGAAESSGVVEWDSRV